MEELLAPTGDPFSVVAPYYDQLMDGVPYQTWVRYLHQLWEHFAVKPSSVLDLACGTGTVALLLAHKGYKVAGVDRSGPMLAQARQKARNAGVSVEFLQQDAADLDLPGQQFDCIISLFDSLNNIVTPASLQNAFYRAMEHTAPGGLFIFDINTEYAFSAGMFNQRSSPLDGPLQYAWRSHYDPLARLCTITMDFSFTPGAGEPARKFREVHVQRAYSKTEILQMLEAAGFSDVSLFNAYTLSPPRKRSDRIFYVAKRPE